MLAALDALIENGTGGRQALVLRQVCGLFLRVGFSGEDETSTLFDDLMATLAMDLDEATLVVLAPELQRMPGVLPGFTSTVLSRFHELAHRREDGELTAPASTGVGAGSADPTLAAIPEQAITSPDNVMAETVTAQAQTFPDEVLQPRAHAQAVAEPAAPAGDEHPPVIAIPEKEARPRPGPPDRRAVQRDPATDALDPLTLARRASPLQLQGIAGLPQLPVGLTGVIMTRGDIDAITIALANPGAAFSRSSLLAVAELAAGDQRLKHSLLQRVDLPECVVQRLLPVIGREARSRLIMSGARADVEAARAALADSQAHGEPVQTLDMLRRDVNEGRTSMSDAIVRLASAHRLAELAALAVAELGMDLAIAHAMVTARLDQPAGVLVRALGGRENAVDSVLSMRRALGMQPQRDLRGPAQICEIWSQEEARLMIALITRHLAAHAEAQSLPAPAPLALAG